MVRTVSLISSLVVLFLALGSVPSSFADECEDYSQGMRLVSKNGLYLGWGTGQLKRPFVLGNYLVGVNEKNLLVVDVSQPNSSSLVTRLDLGFEAFRCFAASGSYVYVAAEEEQYEWPFEKEFGRFSVLDLSDPLSPVIVAETDIAMVPRQVSTRGNWLVVCGKSLTAEPDSFEVLLFDIADPSQPKLLSTTRLDVPQPHITLAHDAMVVSSNGQPTLLYRIKHNGQIRLISTMTPVSGSFTRISCGDILLTMTYDGDLTVTDISNLRTPRIVASLSLDGFGYPRLTVADNKLFVGFINSWSTGVFRVIDISDPRDPRLVGRSSWSTGLDEIAVLGNNLFVVDHQGSSSSLVTVDISNVAIEPSPDWVKVQGGYSHSITPVGENSFCVVNGFGNSLVIGDVSGAVPQVSCTFDLPYSNTFGGMQLGISGSVLYVLRSAIDTVELVDVTNPKVPFGAGSIQLGPEGRYRLMEIAGNRAYLTRDSGWRRLCGSGFEVWDTSDPYNPVVVADIETCYGRPVKIKASGSIVAVVSESWGDHQVNFFDVADLDRPVRGEQVGLGNSKFIGVLDNYFFVAPATYFSDRPLVDIYQVDDARTLTKVSSIEGLTGWPCSMSVLNGFAYFVVEEGVAVVDVKDIYNPRYIDTAGHLPSSLSQKGVMSIACSDRIVVRTYDGAGVVKPQCGVITMPDVREVLVDVNPGNDNNPINCSPRGRGVVPVAILTTPDFDATTVDPTTVRFGPDEAIESHTTGRGTFLSHRERHKKKHERDVDHDGDIDQVFHFRRNDTGIKCGDTKATLTGETYEGQEIIGADRIRTVSRWDKDQVGTRGIRITPNPFNPQTTVSFTTEEPQRVRLAVYDIRGRLLVELTDQQYEVGEHSVDWQGRDSAGRALPSGEYFFRVEMGDRVETRKAMLVR